MLNKTIFLLSLLFFVSLSYADSHNIKNLTNLEGELIQAAITGMNNALTPNQSRDDSRFGAAVLTAQGNIYAAGQYFSDTYSLTAHAEQAALIHAACHGEYKIIAIAIINNKSQDKTTNPCHMCKQLLYETYLRSQIEPIILLLDSKGNLKEKVGLLKMINYPWPRA